MAWKPWGKLGSRLGSLGLGLLTDQSALCLLVGWGPFPPFLPGPAERRESSPSRLPHGSDVEGPFVCWNWAQGGCVSPLFARDLFPLCC